MHWHMRHKRCICICYKYQIMLLFFHLVPTLCYNIVTSPFTTATANLILKTDTPLHKQLNINHSPLLGNHNISSESSPMTFSYCSLLSPADITFGGMTTPNTSTGSEKCKTGTYTWVLYRYKQHKLEQELIKAKQELDALKYVLPFLFL